MDALEKKVGLFRAIFPELSDFEKEDWEENFLVEFTHDSTSIEGNTLTLIETKMILADKIVPAETTLRELDERTCRGMAVRQGLREAPSAAFGERHQGYT